MPLPRELFEPIVLGKNPTGKTPTKDHVDRNGFPDLHRALATLNNFNTRNDLLKEAATDLIICVALIATDGGDLPAVAVERAGLKEAFSKAGPALKTGLVRVAKMTKYLGHDLERALVRLPHGEEIAPFVQRAVAQVHNFVNLGQEALADFEADPTKFLRGLATGTALGVMRDLNETTTNPVKLRDEGQPEIKGRTGKILSAPDNVKSVLSTIEKSLHKLESTVHPSHAEEHEELLKKPPAEFLAELRRHSAERARQAAEQRHAQAHEKAQEQAQKRKLSNDFGIGF